MKKMVGFLAGSRAYQQVVREREFFRRWAPFLQAGTSATGTLSQMLGTPGQELLTAALVEASAFWKNLGYGTLADML